MTLESHISFARALPVRHTVDVFVAGGGPAGVAAAVTAARQGRSVFLAEGQSCFGGMGTSGCLAIFCYLTDLVNFVADGFGREVYDRLWEAGGMAPGMQRDNPHDTVLFSCETLKRVYDEMIVQAEVQCSLLTQLVGVETDGDRVTAAVCAAKSGLFAVTAEVYIDATGDGDLCAWAGAPYEKGDAEGRMQPGTLCSVWADIDWEAADAAGHGIWQQCRHLPRAFADGLFTVPDPHMPGMFPTGRRLGHGNIGHAFGVDGTDERSMTAALLAGRKVMLEYERFYKEYLTGYEQMQLVTTAAQLGIRETRRILGDYVLCLDDFRRRAVFADEIGRFAWPVDIHAASVRPEDIQRKDAEFATLRYAPGESYGIPYRTLLPRTLANVLVAGRCISADRYLQGSVRVMPGCFITGQAAGMAAALASETDTAPRHIAVTALQQRLLEIGAYLPNAQAAAGVVE